MDYTLDCVSHFSSLKTILLLWSNMEFGYGATVVGMNTEAENPIVFAERVRDSLSAVLEQETCVVEKIEVLDYDGDIY